jgi:hypothetical protein
MSLSSRGKLSRNLVNVDTVTGFCHRFLRNLVNVDTVTGFSVTGFFRFLLQIIVAYEFRGGRHGFLIVWENAVEIPIAAAYSH